MSFLLDHKFAKNIISFVAFTFTKLHLVLQVSSLNQNRVYVHILNKKALRYLEGNY